MASLNLSDNGAAIANSYQSVVSAALPTGRTSATSALWALYSVQAPLVNAFQPDAGKESVLKLQSTGSGELVDLLEDFSDGRIQFAFVKVRDPNTALPKNVLVAWCGEGVPERTKGYFTSHLNAVSKLLHGYHVQITARSDRDLTPESIVQKVADSSGSKYSGGGGGAGGAASAASRPPPPVASKPAMPTKSFGAAAGGFQPLGSRTRAPAPAGNTDSDGWGEDAPPVTRSQLEKVDSAYRPTKVDMAQLQSQREPSNYQAPAPAGGGADVVRGAYQPVGKVDINAIRRQAQEQGRVTDDRPTVVKGAYEPVGKVDIADIRRKAQGAPAPAPAHVPSQSSGGDDDDERPKSLADRSAAFTGDTGDGRLTSLPKPTVSNRFGTQASTFTGTKAPAPGGFEAKPVAPSVAPVSSTSKTFADEGGKTPAQVWAEKKARERGASSAADTQPPVGGGAPASPIASQTSGGWQSGYAGKKWGVQIPTRTGGSGVGEQRTGPDEPPVEGEEQPPTGGVGSIRDRFKDAAPMGAAREQFGGAPEPPPLDTSSKPNAGVRGVPIPGLPQRPQDDVAAEEQQTLPPPPPRPMPADEEEDDDDEEAEMPQGSPVRIAMPIARDPEPAPLEKAEPLPPRAMPTESLSQTATRHSEPEPAVADEQPAHDGGREAIAQYDYEKAEDNELELHDGERVTNIEMVDEDWWMGQNSRGETGLFPANYVELLPESASGGPPAPAPAPAPVAQPAAVAAAAAAAPPPPEPPLSDVGKTAIAQYDYQAEEDNELSFPDGAQITEIEFPDEDWWLGHYNGRSGLFPANYVLLEN